MHKYFDFKKIYEAESLGEPLKPEEMGTPTLDSNIDEMDSSVKLEDFTKMSIDNILEITLTSQDIENLKNGESVLKEDSEWKKKDNETIITPIKLVIINTKNETSKNDPTALVFNLDEDIVNEIVDNVSSQAVMQPLKGTGQEGLEIPNIMVRFIKSIDLSVNHDEKAVPASPEQIAQGMVTPEKTEGSLPNESKNILKFDQFVNENKKKWIGGLDMKKGALKKVMGDDDISMDDLNKKEKSLKKKDKDKKKPGIQLNAKDAKTRKRIVLAKNLMKASGADKK